MTELVFVGTSDAFGAGGRRQSAMVLRAPHGAVLVDCGATTCTGLSAVGIPRAEIDAIVISHFHADHFGGVPTGSQRQSFGRASSARMSSWPAASAGASQSSR